VKTNLYRDFALDEAYTSGQARLQSPGQFWCTTQPDGSLKVERADLVVWVTGQLLSIIHQGGGHPDVSLECHGDYWRDSSDLWPDHVLRIKTSGQRYVYVIGPCVDEQNEVWEARWPD
jgi:hypothetical protein